MEAPGREEGLRASVAGVGTARCPLPEPESAEQQNEGAKGGPKSELRRDHHHGSESNHNEQAVEHRNTGIRQHATRSQRWQERGGTPIAKARNGRANRAGESIAASLARASHPTPLTPRSSAPPPAKSPTRYVVKGVRPSPIRDDSRYLPGANVEAAWKQQTAAGRSRYWRFIVRQPG